MKVIFTKDDETIEGASAEEIVRKLYDTAIAPPSTIEEYMTFASSVLFGYYGMEIPTSSYQEYLEGLQSASIITISEEK